MITSFILCILCILAVFGAVCFAVAIINPTVISPPEIIISYNSEDEIEGIIRKILAKHPFSEVIVIDRGSCDDTLKIVTRLAQKESRIKLITRE